MNVRFPAPTVCYDPSRRRPGIRTKIRCHLRHDRCTDEIILQSQSQSDADYFLRVCGRTFDPDDAERIRAEVLGAYRWQYIVSGVQGRFGEVLSRFITPVQQDRIGRALAPILS